MSRNYFDMSIHRQCSDHWLSLRLAFLLLSPWLRYPAAQLWGLLPQQTYQNMKEESQQLSVFQLVRFPGRCSLFDNFDHVAHIEVACHWCCLVPICGPPVLESCWMWRLREARLGDLPKAHNTSQELIHPSSNFVTNFFPRNSRSTSGCLQPNFIQFPCQVLIKFTRYWIDIGREPRSAPRLQDMESLLANVPIALSRVTSHSACRALAHFEFLLIYVDLLIFTMMCQCVSLVNADVCSVLQQM